MAVLLLCALQQKLLTLTGENEDQTHGIKLALRAMEAPTSSNRTQTQATKASVVTNNVKAGEGSYGYNAGNDTYGDMLEMGILDPTESDS